MVRFRNTDIEATATGEIYIGGLRVRSISGKITVLDGEEITIDKIMAECFPHGKPPQAIHDVIDKPKRPRPTIVGEHHKLFTGYWIYDSVYYTTAAAVMEASGDEDRQRVVIKCKQGKGKYGFLPKEDIWWD